MAKSYKYYTLIDFLADEDFKAWVICPNDQHLTSKWNQVRLTHPYLIPLMDTARDIVLALRKEKPSAAMVQQAMDWGAIQQKLEYDPDLRRKVPLKRFSYLWKAAAVLIAIAVGFYFIQRKTPMVEVATAYGEELEITLPDGSKTILYPHSVIRYAGTWKPGETRQIWVEGETHLSVVKIKQPATDNGENIPFKVYLNDSLSVTVLGTEFLVYNRENHPLAVQLESGLVQVNLPNETVRLLPGESVTHANSQGLVKHTEPLAISRLVETGELALRNARVDETFQYIEANFGITVHTESAFQSRRLDGVIPFTSAEETLSVLAAILDGQLIEPATGIFHLSEK